MFLLMERILVPECLLLSRHDKPNKKLGHWSPWRDGYLLALLRDLSLIGDMAFTGSLGAV